MICRRTPYLFGVPLGIFPPPKLPYGWTLVASPDDWLKARSGRYKTLWYIRANGKPIKRVPMRQVRITLDTKAFERGLLQTIKTTEKLSHV